MISRSHALLQGSRIPLASLSAPLGCGCASYKPPRRCYATRAPAPKKIAVLGGGITGLSTAYYLSRSLPNVTITLYEGSGRMGGWLNSKRESVPGGGYVTFEQGPRTLRKSPWALFALDMCLDLGMKDELIFVPKTAPAAQNRYIYDKDHIVRLPSGIRDVISSLNEPTIRNLVLEAIREPFRKPPLKGSREDESIGQFLARRGLKQTSDDLASAFLHGIYAGNIDELSAYSTPPFDSVWHDEAAYGSIIRSMMAKPPNSWKFPARLTQMTKHLPFQLLKQNPQMFDWYANSSVFALQNGLGSLANALELRLKQKRVNIVKEEVLKLEKEPVSGGIMIYTSARKNASLLKSHDLVISALPAKTTSEIASAGMSSKSGSASLVQNRQIIQEALNVPTVTVMVVNLFYKQPGLLPVKGFGYLIPQTVPMEQNPEMALGVIFDSDTIPEWDTVKGTKVTVMLGGHWWDGLREADLPTEEEAVLAAKSLLARHLGIDAEPLLSNANLQKNCIPQYKVGHHRKMVSAHHALQQTFEGKLRVVGNSYYGVSVHDCIVGARQMALKVEEEVASGEMRSDRTGLEYLVEENLGWAVDVNTPKELQ
ncbi:uncharacterized protein BKA78DRAFT_257194 [Phyllosticta capitalensis]|uniref:uncharacterized protein n=1 Tax=Phyllosticta capitalensis TaxID=121624 RepID=UPI00312F5389